LVSLSAVSVTAKLHRGPGRPRDHSCDRAILDATVELVSDHGYEGTSVDAIAARAGVSKPTIYRRWPGGKEELVAAAVRERREAIAHPIDTGTLRGDLVEVVEQMIGGMHQHAHLAAGLTQRLRESTELAAVFREHVVAEDRARFRVIVDRAVSRGELRRAPGSAALLADVAPALVHFRGLLSGDALDDAFAAQFVDSVLLPALHVNESEREAAR
jgi:AcrR family transcriptional regulator